MFTRCVMTLQIIYGFMTLNLNYNGSYLKQRLTVVTCRWVAIELVINTVINIMRRLLEELIAIKY